MANSIRLVETVQECPKLKRRIMTRVKSTGSWLMAHGTTVQGKVPSCKEFRDFLCDCYKLTPTNSQKKCDGFSKPFYVHHTLNFKNIRLIIERHNEVHDNPTQLMKRYFSPNCICGEPLTHQDHSRSNEEVHHRKGEKDTGGDVLIRKNMVTSD